MKFKQIQTPPLYFVQKFSQTPEYMQIKQLEELVELQKREIENSKKDTLFSKIIATIALIVSIISAIGTYIPYIIK